MHNASMQWVPTSTLVMRPHDDLVSALALRPHDVELKKDLLMRLVQEAKKPSIHSSLVLLKLAFDALAADERTASEKRLRALLTITRDRRARVR